MSRPLLVFDLDGTLVDTAHDLIAALNVALGQDGIAPLPAQLVGHLVGRGGRAMVERALAYHQISAGQARIERIVQAFLAAYEADIAIHSRPYPGVLAALDRFQAAGWGLAVCTNKPEALAIRLMRDLRLLDRFPILTGGDTFPFKKPDGRHILNTIARAGGHPGRAIMIGDSRTDIDAARNAGVPVIAVTFGYTDVPVDKLGPDGVISFYDELWDEVDWQMRRTPAHVSVAQAG